MNTFKKITLTSAVAFALFAFNACGDDSNSTSAPGENSALSSAVEDDESSSSVIPDPDRESSSSSRMSSSATTENLDKSSSSVKGSEPAEVSSSSAKETKNSSDSRSSSSVKSGDSSSSSKDKSSSSVNSSSSNKQSSSSVKSSSSSVKQSSSSVASSSSEYVPFDHSKAFDGTLWRKGAYETFVDKRNDRKYYYLQVDGKDTAGKAASIKVMAENLNVGEMVRGFKDQKDDSKIERYCYDNDTTNCDRYGGLYQWAEMMNLPFECNSKSCADSIEPNHKGICPDGWRLLTYNDFYIIVNSNGNQDGVKGTRSTFGFGGSNDTGYSLVGAGLRKDNGLFSQLNDITLWYYPAELVDNGNVYPKSGSTTYSGKAFYPENHGNYTKLAGFSVRCVMNE